ncbi:acyltransferase family protein [Gottfriedia luciferensis]|uniref:acyltransferase family protein n=1 Tax=Gottfriedia luciferensis TaxID=178774 RepID=UPI000B431C36|nr:acyltransferase family protein [Gottfriedia luciferensis]
MKIEREKWLDVAKMIGIFLVVYGHSTEGPNSITFIYWFHMPLFFIISGYLFKPVNSVNELKFYIKKLTFRLLIPYCTYLILFSFYNIAIDLLAGSMSTSTLLNEGKSLLIGGRFITGVHGVFWYVTCLFITQILFALICLYFKKNSTRFLIVIACYLIAHFETIKVIPYIGKNSFNQISIPWNIDVALLSIFFLGLGFFTKKYIASIPNFFGIVCISLSILYMVLYEMDKLDYHLSLKYLRYDHLFLDALIPITMVVALLFLCQKLAKLQIIQPCTIFGKESITIMYIHIFANAVLSQFFDYGPLMYTIIGLVVPMLAKKFIIEPQPIIKPLFIGLNVKRKQHLKVRTV